MTEEIRTTSSTGGEKGVKDARYDLIPAGPLKELAELYGVGAKKYAERNWERGYEWSKSFAALNRHLWAFWNSEDIDPETGKAHIASVAWHAFALLEFMETHSAFDDRPRPSKLETKIVYEPLTVQFSTPEEPPTAVPHYTAQSMIDFKSEAPNFLHYTISGMVGPVCWDLVKNHPGFINSTNDEVLVTCPICSGFLLWRRTKEDG